MAIEVGASGTKLHIMACGISCTVSNFADDQQPFTVATHELVDAKHDINGNAVYGAKFGWIEISVGVIPDSQEDYELYGIASRTQGGLAKGMASKDVTLTIIPPGSNMLEQRVFVGGRMKSAPAEASITNEARKTGKVYTFIFNAGDN